MKRSLLILFTLFLSKILLAEHITGGEMYYTYLGSTPEGHKYQITLKLFRHCLGNGAQLDNTAAIGIFNKSTGGMIWTQRVPMQTRDELRLSSPGPCVTNAPEVCYQVGFYEFTVELPESLNGYTVSYQRCCRIFGINNLINSGGSGATYLADIPGTN
ncbi:MAG: hypothetical protein EOP49_20820, partial [Sphingobacteriales bacterium]